jgi:hypothetical protein
MVGLSGRGAFATELILTFLFALIVVTATSYPPSAGFARRREEKRCEPSSKGLRDSASPPRRAPVAARVHAGNMGQGQAIDAIRVACGKLDRRLGACALSYHRDTVCQKVEQSLSRPRGLRWSATPRLVRRAVAARIRHDETSVWRQQRGELREIIGRTRRLMKHKDGRFSGTGNPVVELSVGCIEKPPLHGGWPRNESGRAEAGVADVSRSSKPRRLAGNWRSATRERPAEAARRRGPCPSRTSCVLRRGEQAVPRSGYRSSRQAGPSAPGPAGFAWRPPDRNRCKLRAATLVCTRLVSA